ncbi:MAG: hypothetical protein ACK55I_29295, partial [bacterium]
TRIGRVVGGADHGERTNEALGQVGPAHEARARCGHGFSLSQRGGKQGTWRGGGHQRKSQRGARFLQTRLGGWRGL